MDNQQSQNEITIIYLLQQIRQIDKEADFNIFPSSHLIDLHSLQLHPYLQCLNKVQDQLARYRLQEDQYKKLQSSLQKQETEIRKRISIEQQLKLYTDALKAQVEEVEKQKLQLLQNSKIYIKSLKSSNQKLYLQLCKVKTSKPASPNKPNKSLSNNKPKHDKSIRQIIKTQYIERNHSNSAQQKKHNKNKKPYSTISGHEASEGLQQNSKTFYLAAQSNKKEKLNSHPSKKKNKFLFSNYTLLNYLQSSNRKLKKQEKSNLAKSPPNKPKRNSRWKQKKANKSTFCITSVEPSSNKKQTI